MTFELTDEERQELADLATLSPVEYDRCRKEAAKRFCCRVGMLDQEVQALRNGRPGEKETTEQGTALTIADPEPWPVPVDGSDLLDELAAAFRLFLALAEHADVALALWTVHAHAHDTAEVSPILGITSPDKRCGKTTLLFLLGALVPRSLPAANVTPAAMFRTVEKYRPTLLVDEGDTFLKSNDELRGILNSGHSKGAAIVVRTVGEDHEPRTFSTWGPKAIALIGKLPGTLADRAIEVPMQRKTGAERVEKLRLDRLGGLEPLRQQAWRWTRDELEDLQTADPVVPEALHDRAADNWRPLLAIADQAGGEWPARARRAALALSGLAADEEESAGVLALHDVAALFEELEQEQLSSEAIVNRLVEMDERPWPEWYGKPLSKGALARLLRPFDVRPRQLWIAGQKARGYRREDFEEPLSRYVTPSESVGLVEWLN
ncbi:MAG: DUF3631 domain-containing protein, partial [Gammaproteobacteria bacterium]